MFYCIPLVALKYITCINFLFYVVEAAVVAVGDDCLREGLKLVEVVYYATAKECAAIFECGLIYYHLGTFGFYAFHHTLYGRLTEIVAVALHRQAEDTDGAMSLFICVVIAFAEIVIVSGFAQYLVGDKIFTGAVTLDNGAHHILGDILIVSQ